MAELNPEEHRKAQEIAYRKALARGNGEDPPPFDLEASIGDFWQAAAEVIAQRDHSCAPSIWRVMYGARGGIKGQIVEKVRARLTARRTGPRNQVRDDAVFEPLATASAILIGRGDYGFAIDLFQECFALAREFEENNHCQIHKGAMTFNVAVAYLRANDFAAAMHYFELAQIETQQTTGNMGWGIYDSDLFQQNYWRILDLYEQQSPVPLYGTFWGVPFGSAAARHDWDALSDNSKLLYIVLNAERISYRRLSSQPHMLISDSFGLSYWNLIADLVRLLETELGHRRMNAIGLRGKILNNVLHSPIAAFHTTVMALHRAHPINDTLTFNQNFPLLRATIENAAEPMVRRIASAVLLAGGVRNQVQHHVDTGMIVFTDRAAATFTAEVLLCLCRVDAWAA